MRRYSLLLFALMIGLSLLALPAVSWAQAPGVGGNPAQGQTQNPSGPPMIENPLRGVGDPRVLVGKIISAALGVVGSISLVVFLYGGFTWMTSGGNPDRVRHGRDLIVWAAIGLFVIFASYAMVRWVLETVVVSTR